MSIGKRANEIGGGISLDANHRGSRGLGRSVAGAWMAGTNLPRQAFGGKDERALYAAAKFKTNLTFSFFSHVCADMVAGRYVRAPFDQQFRCIFRAVLYHTLSSSK